MSLLPIPAIMRERVALSTMSGICRFLTDSEEYLRRRISREASGTIKCDDTTIPGASDDACVDSVPGVQDGQLVRIPHSSPERPVRVLRADGEHMFRRQSQFGCDP